MPKAKNKARATEETSAGTAQIRKRAGNKFSQMLSPKSRPADNAEETDQTTSHQRHSEQTQVPVIENDQGNPSLNSQTEDVDMSRRKSVESLASQPIDEPSRRSVESPSGGIQRRSSELMEIDDSVRNDEYFNNSGGDNQRESRPRPSQPKTYLSKEEFDYTMNLFDTKITAIYKLCRFIGDKQKEDSKSLRRLVALDELSDDFWNRAYREVVKKLLPTILFPSVSEFRRVLEEYLAEHAEHFIESIGRNSWISMFEDKLLPEIKNKCRSKRNDIASSIRHAMFIIFGDKLDYIDNNASAVKIVEWKSNNKTKTAYEALYSESDLLAAIGNSVFKQYKDKELPTTHCAYIVAICDIVLNPKSPGIKCNDKSVVKRVNAFLHAYENKEPVTPEIMEQIAEEEAEAMDASRRRKESSSQTGGSEILEDDDDYDNLIAGLDETFS